MTIYTSELAAKALGLEQTGQAHTSSACACAMCQRSIALGDVSCKLDLPRTFQDFEKLGASGFLCGYCAATTNQQAMRALQRCVITRDAVYPLNTDDSRAWLWSDPPPPPFAVVINHSTMAAFHYFWRTPVTLDQRFVVMNVDNVIYEVNRDRIAQALKCADMLVKASEESGQKKEILKSPFIVLSRDPTKNARNSHGHLSHVAIALGKTSPQLGAAVDFLQSMTPGELIALSPFLKQNPATPIKPTPTQLEI